MSHIVDTIRRAAEPPDRQAPLIENLRQRRTGQPELGLVQYFHMGDHAAVERALETLSRLPIKHLRTSISWCDWMCDGGEAWYRWLIPQLINHASVLPCFLYTPPELGMLPKSSSPPRDPQAYGEFVEMVLREHLPDQPFVELWNEPNNYIEWDWTVDPEWKIFSAMIAGAAGRAAKLGVRSVLGGMSPFDPNWLDLMFKRGAMEHIDVIGVHGFPGTWEAVWEGWDTHVGRVNEVIERHGGAQQVWVTESGYSTWSHDEFGQLKTMVELAQAPAQRVYWYSLEDLAPERETLDGFHCDERAYHFGLRRHAGPSKLLGRVLEDHGVEGARELVRFADRPAADPGAHALITGGAGFIGTNLADRLAATGTAVTILDSLVRPGVEENLRWLKHKHRDRIHVEVGDVRDKFALRRAMRGAARVFHLAAQVAVTTSLDHPHDDLTINAQGTVNMLEEARRLPDPPAIVFTSTNKVYGRLESIELCHRERGYEPVAEMIRARGISERQALEFCSPYGCSKGVADQYVLDYARSFGLPTCVFRMSCIYGPHQHGNEDQGWVAHFLLSALRGDPITVFGDGQQTRDLLYVGDLIAALITASESESALSGRVFNIGGGVKHATSVNQVIDMIGRLLGEPVQVLWDEWRVADQRYYISDTSAFTQLTGWRPQVSIESGLAKLSAWLTRAREDLPETPLPTAGATAAGQH